MGLTSVGHTSHRKVRCRFVKVKRLLIVYADARSLSRLVEFWLLIFFYSVFYVINSLTILKGLFNDCLNWNDTSAAILSKLDFESGQRGLGFPINTGCFKRLINTQNCSPLSWIENMLFSELFRYTRVFAKPGLSHTCLTHQGFGLGFYSIIKYSIIRRKIHLLYLVNFSLAIVLHFNKLLWHYVLLIIEEIIYLGCVERLYPLLDD